MILMFVAVTHSCRTGERSKFVLDGRPSREEKITSPPEIGVILDILLSQIASRSFSGRT